MNLVDCFGPPFVVLCCLAGPLEASPIADTAPQRPASAASEKNLPATGVDVFAQASDVKPMKLEFDVPASIIGPARDSIQRQLDSASSGTRDATAPRKAEASPGEPASPRM